MNPAYPVPKDLPLPLPASLELLKALLVAAFLSHILFVNLMVGGTLLGLLAEWKGRQNARYRALARRIADTVTVNKSLAVVLGVGPLLLINLAYTLQFYTANILTGHAWIAIVPLVTLAFLLAYWHGATWESMSQERHLALQGVTAGLFLFIPLIFLANINLMLFPDKWTSVQGFFSSLLIGNVFPRYLHFLTASLAVTGLVLGGWFAWRPGGEDRAWYLRGGYDVTFHATSLQFLFGPLVLLTLPEVGLGWDVIGVIGTGVLFAMGAMALLTRERRSPAEELGRHYWPIAGLLTLTVCFMGTGRHLYRENALREQQRLITERTARYEQLVQAALNREYLPEEEAPETETASGNGDVAEVNWALGEKTYKQVCMACHMPDRVVVGPPLTEIAGIYKDDPEGIVTWTKKPGRKREAMPPMPPFPLPDKTLRAVAAYMLREGAAPAH